MAKIIHHLQKIMKKLKVLKTNLIWIRATQNDKSDRCMLAPLSLSQVPQIKTLTKQIKAS